MTKYGTKSQFLRADGKEKSPSFHITTSCEETDNKYRHTGTNDTNSFNNRRKSNGNYNTRSYDGEYQSNG